ncbi:MAG: deoxyhypusine synthase [Nanoarchaeota archaeon]|jgi:deoxyhypusine synthase|nr:deoxyhypusine synthase [Nanoarchaeota archaeon]|tara:strand:- start:32566 stop:33582 length:1017 start_codon:yes stop_codon:yes gene_type:complete
MWIWDKRQELGKKPKNYLSLDKFPKIQGLDLEKEFNLDSFLETYTHMGFQGSNLGMAISILKEMLEKKTPIYMSFTGNMISSGNRELITYLVKNKLLAGIVTSAASIEEDVMKSHLPFHLGTFEASGSFLLENTIGRIGNIFVPAERYLYFERFLNELIPEIYKKQKSLGKVFCTHEITKEIGLHIAKNEYTQKNKETSFLYWAAVHNIPVFCPGITDGGLGDISTFIKKKYPDFYIDITGDNQALTKKLMNEKTAGCIVLGGGLSKHFLLNAAIFRDGFEYAIYLTTATYFDGSDSGGNQEEAISWAKIKPQGKRVKVISDATITFPILMSALKCRK